MSSKAQAWLNAAFLEKMLRTSENDQSIEVKEFVTKPAVKKGDNYGSDMTRVSMEYYRNITGRKVVKKKSVILKVAVTIEEQQDELVTTLFKTEIEMMTTTLVAMTKILNEQTYRLSACVLYTEIGNPSLLVIEDLTPLGYRMGDRQTGLDLDHCILAMKGLAKFHASSVALREKDPAAINISNKSMYEKDYPEAWKDYFINGLTVLGNEILNWSEMGFSAMSYSEKILKLSKICYERAGESLKVEAGEFDVLNHGDFWVNNMLFRYDDEGKVVNHIFVDFQLSIWTSPAIDILHFFNLSLSEDVDLHHRGALLTEYLDTLTKTMSRLRCKTKPPNLASLEKSLVDHEFYGMISTFVMLPLVLMDSSETMSFQNMVQQEGGYKNPAYSAPAYRKILLRRLPTWDARGLLDVE